MWFQEEATVRLHSVIFLKTDEVVLLLIYLGRHTFMVKVENVFPKINVAPLVVAIQMDMGEKIVVIQTTNTVHKNGPGQIQKYGKQCNLRGPGKYGRDYYKRRCNTQS